MITPRTRRVAGVAAIAIALLLAGRWTADFVAERWWASTISPAAAAFVSNWQLLGIALDLSAILLASIWFVMHALLVARAIASVQVAHRIGDLQLREAVPTRLLLGGAAAAGILLGLIAGAGAHAWREPIMLAWQGVTYGVRDPFLGQDFGVYVAQLPAWDLGHRFLVLLGLLGLAFCVSLYSGIGAIRRDGRRLTVHPDARQHLGGLLAFIAAVIGLGYILAPYHVVADAAPSLTAPAAALRIHAAQVMAGVAVATTILTLWWSIRGQNRILVAGWCVLVVAAVGTWIVLPLAAVDTPMTAPRDASAMASDRIAWGIRDVAPLPAADSVPVATSVWDEPTLAAAADRSGSAIEAATPTLLAGTQPAWRTVTSLSDDVNALEVLTVADDSVSTTGAPIALASGDPGRASRPLRQRITDVRTRPDAGTWRSTSSGVGVSGPLRRLMLAWARQAPGMLTAASGSFVDWHLDPVGRASAVLPMFDWLPADVASLNARLVWVVQGMLSLDRFPLATVGFWDGERAAGAAPVVVAVIDVASGETHFYLDPAADSLAAAWSRLVGPVIAPARELPVAIRSQLTYPRQWFDAQLIVLATEPWNGRQRLTRVLNDGADASVWLAGRYPARQAAFEDPTHGGVTALMTAYRLAGMPQLQVARREADGITAANRTELRQRWSRSASALHLRDSATAAGDTVVWRAMHWQLGGGAIAAWQGMFAVPHRGPASLLWIATAIDDRVGGGRTPGEAWRSVATADSDGVQALPDALVLDQARQWLRRADSAFRRGDLTAFGRAFEELRQTLKPMKP